MAPESALTVLRKGVLPHFSDDALAYARHALMARDEMWVQGATTSPPPLQCTQDWPIECGCFVALLSWGEFTTTTGLHPTVGEVEERFAKACYQADLDVGEPAGCRWLLNWHDEDPRDEVKAVLIHELDAELKRRHTP